MTRISPSEPAARRLVRAVRGVKRARARVCGAARRASPREKIIARLARKIGYPREVVAETVGADLELHKPRAMPADIFGPIHDAFYGRRGRDPVRALDPADESGDRERRADLRERLDPERSARADREGRIGTNPRRKRRRSNPALPTRAQLEQGVELFRKWSGFDAGSIDRRRVPAGTPRVLVKLGDLVAIGYRSDKWGGKKRDYIHETKRPHPSLFATPDGRRLVILGGAVRVRPEGLVG